ncbi:MAG TPA: hypothetical protein VG871_13300, partial [Vicinamibacterales bacterium]|nr:hypothetical protein [Vicinamibacterales bacterium]
MKSRVIFTCQHCGAQAQKWLGRCPDCGEWNSYVEEIQAPADRHAVASGRAGGGRPQLYADVDTVVSERIATGIGELDRVLGG